MFSTVLLKGLASAGSISKLTARGVPGGFMLYAQIGLDEAALKAYRGEARVFKRLDAVARYVKELGFAQFSVEMVGWVDGEGLL